MSDIIIGTGKLAGKGVYAGRDFNQGELVMKYNLRKLTQIEFDALPHEEHKFAHSFWGQIYLYPEPARYVNHSLKPNTCQNLKMMCDFAIKSIKKGEMITTNATIEIKHELETFLEVYEKDNEIKNLKWLKMNYRNAICTYSYNGKLRQLTFKRIAGNWHVVNQN